MALTTRYSSLVIGNLREKQELEVNNFIKQVAETAKGPVVLLTHIPLHKPEGICVDPPMIRMNSGRVLKQNYLSVETTKMLIKTLKPKWVISGHAHDGCLLEHKIVNRETMEIAHRNLTISEANEVAKSLNDRVIEITCRSAMGEFGGNVELFEIKKALSGNLAKKLMLGFEYAVGECPFVTHITARVLLVVDTLVLSGLTIWAIFSLCYCNSK